MSDWSDMVEHFGYDPFDERFCNKCGCEISNNWCPCRWQEDGWFLPHSKLSDYLDIIKSMPYEKESIKYEDFYYRRYGKRLSLWVCCYDGSFTQKTIFGMAIHHPEFGTGWKSADWMTLLYSKSASSGVSSIEKFLKSQHEFFDPIVKMHHHMIEWEGDARDCFNQCVNEIAEIESQDGDSYLTSDWFARLKNCFDDYILVFGDLHVSDDAT